MEIIVHIDENGKKEGKCRFRSIKIRDEDEKRLFEIIKHSVDINYDFTNIIMLTKEEYDKAISQFYDFGKEDKKTYKMKGYFCFHCGKEILTTIRNGETIFYCECDGAYTKFAYFREIEDNDCCDKNEYNNEIKVHDTIHVNYYEANEIIKLYLSKNVFISKVVEDTHLDIAMVNSVLSDLFEHEVK